MNTSAEHLALADALLEFGVMAQPEQVERLVAFVALAEKWNLKFNIVSRKDIDRFVSRHLLDSLSILPWVHGTRIVDLGSGGGLPGIPLAIVRPEAELTLLERSEKKARFLSFAVRELKLANAKVVVMDAKVYRPRRGYDVLVSRAVAPPAKVWSLGAHLLAEGGRMVLHAAVGTEVDHVEMPQQVARDTATVNIPGLTEPHQVLMLERPVEKAIH